MTGVGGEWGAEPFCILLSVLCFLVSETPDSFFGEKTSAVGGGVFFVWVPTFVGMTSISLDFGISHANCHRFRQTLPRFVRLWLE